ncbi:MAG: tetratricopeptide repeat protein [Gemmatimonadaceae bacterium]|nr:tetratricopeptide repeat protein [Gemmatimonadaceae bacterium]
MLASQAIGADPRRALPVQLRRLLARLRLGQGAAETERECRRLLSIAEAVGTTGAVVQTQSLLVQALARMGNTSEAIQIAESSLRLAESSGDSALAGEAMHRLAITLLAERSEEAVELLLRLVSRARASGEKVMEARAFLSLGVARVQTRDYDAGTEAFRAALAIAQEAQALDVAANASMNLGVLGLRGGDFEPAHEALREALRLFTTLRNNANRLATLYNLADLERERGDDATSVALYRETAVLAGQLGADDLAIGAQAGIGLAALTTNDVPAAQAALATAFVALDGRADWWFQRRERLESLIIRLDVHGGRYAAASERFHQAMERLEASDVYSAAWLVADCAADLLDHDDLVWPAVERLATHPMASQFMPLAARFTALRDMADRRNSAHLRLPDGFVVEEITH